MRIAALTLAACAALPLTGPGPNRATAAPEPAKAAPQWRAFWVDAFSPGIKTPAEV